MQSGQEMLSGMWLTSWMSSLSLHTLSSSFESANSVIHCDTVNLRKFVFWILFWEFSVLCKVPIHPVFPGTVLFLKRNFPAFWKLFLWCPNVPLFDLVKFNSCHCSNAVGPYPTPMVSEFTICYLWFHTCVCGNHSGICLVMLAMLWNCII